MKNTEDQELLKRCRANINGNGDGYGPGSADIDQLINRVEQLNVDIEKCKVCKISDAIINGQEFSMMLMEICIDGYMKEVEKLNIDLNKTEKSPQNIKENLDAIFKFSHGDIVVCELISQKTRLLVKNRILKHGQGKHFNPLGKIELSYELIFMHQQGLPAVELKQKYLSFPIKDDS